MGKIKSCLTTDVTTKCKSLSNCGSSIEQEQHQMVQHEGCLYRFLKPKSQKKKQIVGKIKSCLTTDVITKCKSLSNCGSSIEQEQHQGKKQKKNMLGKIKTCLTIDAITKSKSLSNCGSSIEQEQHQMAQHEGCLYRFLKEKIYILEKLNHVLQ